LGPPGLTPPGTPPAESWVAEPDFSPAISCKYSHWMRPKITFPEDDQAINLGDQRSLDALLGAIQETFSPEAILYVEGTTAPDVEALLESSKIRPDVEIARGTVWPKSRAFHIPVTEENLVALLELARGHVAPEMCEHLVVYRDGQFLLWAHDAYGGYVHVSPSLHPEVIGRLRGVVAQSTPSGKQSEGEMLFITSQLKVAQRKLREKYASRVAKRGGVLGVQIARASYPRHRIKTVGLDADVTWEDTKIYDHRHGEVLIRRWFSSSWEKRRSVDDAVDLIEDQIQDWIETGPFLTEPVEGSDPGRNKSP